MLASSTIGGWVLRCRPLHVRRLTIQASFLEAHNVYVQQHRTAAIPKGFVVPSDSPEWPPELHDGAGQGGDALPKAVPGPDDVRGRCAHFA